MYLVSAPNRPRAECAPASVPDMNIDLEVKVLLEAGHSDRREAQGRKGDRPSEGSVERNRVPMNKNRIRGGAVQGEPAGDGEALVAKGLRRRFGGGAVKADVLTRGDLASGLKGPRCVRVAERGVL